MIYRSLSDAETYIRAHSHHSQPLLSVVIITIEGRKGPPYGSSRAGERHPHGSDAMYTLRSHLNDDGGPGGNSNNDESGDDIDDGDVDDDDVDEDDDKLAPSSKWSCQCDLRMTSKARMASVVLMLSTSKCSRCRCCSYSDCVGFC